MYTTKAVERAYSVIRDRIVTGVYPSALRITEQEIADATGVSRTPVREALRRLQAEGFVSVHPNQGAIVTAWTNADLNDVLELRGLLEPYGAARAAVRIDAPGLATLRELAARQYQESTQRATGYLDRIGDLNSRFHRTLQSYSQNKRLIALLPALVEAPLVLHTFSKYGPEDLMRSAGHHVELVSALEARDPEWAASVMRSHILAAHSASRESPTEVQPAQ